MLRSPDEEGDAVSNDIFAAQTEETQKDNLDVAGRAWASSRFISM